MTPEQYLQLVDAKPAGLLSGYNPPPFSGLTPQQQQMLQNQPQASVRPRAQGILGGIMGALQGAGKAIYGDDEMTRLRRQNAFQAMTLNPNQALIASNAAQITGLQDRAVKTAEDARERANQAKLGAYNALLATPKEQRGIIADALYRRLLDAGLPENEARITPDIYNNDALLQAGAAFFSQQQSMTLPASYFEREALMRRLPTGPDGQLLPVEQMTAEQQAIAVEMGLVPRAGISSVERIAMDEFLGRQVAAQRAREERATMSVQLDLRPKIESAIAEAKARSGNLVEAEQDLAILEAGLPGLYEVVDLLNELAEEATYTLGGQAFNFAARQLGFEPGEGATARASFISIVDNQVLPLLKQTFGAAFTEKEGQALRDTLGNPDLSPQEKKVQLNAFIRGKEREIRTASEVYRRSLNQAQGAAVPTVGQSPVPVTAPSLDQVPVGVSPEDWALFSPEDKQAFIDAGKL